jgi:hypothetical protein
MPLHVVAFWDTIACSDTVGYHNFNVYFTLKMEAARSSETLVSYHIIARCQHPEDNDFNLHRRETLKSLIEN